MSTITEYFEQAQFSLAAYAIGLLEGISEPYTDALEAAGMTQKQAEEFAAVYSVVDQYIDPISGFSATVFAKGNQEYLAVRGTELDNLGVFMDVIADVGVFEELNGIQQYQQLGAYYSSLLASGKVQAGSLQVTGHSLGGLLAQMFAVDHAGEVTQTTTFNAPGIGGAVADFLIAAGVIAPSISVSNITNIIAQAGLSVTAGLGTLLGDIQYVVIEDQSPNLLANHSIKYLTDALAIYDLFARVDPSVSMDTVTSIIKAASNRTVNTLESALAELGWVYRKAYSSGEAASRDVFYANLYELQGVIGLNHGTVVSLVGKNREQIASLAKTDIAYRYALEWLDPFVVTGNPGLYTNHNVDGHLNDGEDNDAGTTWRMAV